MVGDFNHWDGRRHPMRNRGECGIWEIFLPGLCEGEIYKYEIRSRESGALLLKADPHAFRYELPPRTGSVVYHVLLKPFPYREPDRLAILWET